MKFLLSLLFALVFSIGMQAQSLPERWSLDELNHRMTIGDLPNDDFFNVDSIRTIYLEFASSNWFNTLTSYFNSGTELAATLTYNGVAYDQVGVSFKGATSYNQVNGDKKSFNIRMDSNIDGQTLEGYEVLNLNNCFDDASFLREFFYLYSIRHYVPAAKCSFVELVVNGEAWGLYPMVQQLDGVYTKQWFMSNDGVRWRADAPSGGGGGMGGGGGPNWGDGTAALNYLGSDTADYQSYYTLKHSGIENPWDKLVNTCDVLNNTSIANLPSELPNVLDVDRTLWFLACENAFADDDSYIMKGKMDYYAYWEYETGRITPLEYDGNSVLDQGALAWSPFYHADNANYPLLNKMLQVPEYRQRYIAHLRTIITDMIDPALAAQTIAEYGDMIDAHVEADTKKLYSYNQFTSGVTTLNTYLQTRRNNIMNNSEVNTTGASITDVVLITAAGNWMSPVANEEVSVTTQVISVDGIDHVWLYYSDELVGNFTKVQMLDDGNNDDGSASDGVYGAHIPGMPLGSLIRFYVEAIEANTAKTATYMPVGAEHDVYVYSVTVEWAESSDVVLNELMSDNSATAMDEASQYEDWIELYNNGTSAVDLSNYYITDNTLNLLKWQFPSGTTLGPDSYLILWADEDAADGAHHTNFKLSSSGETVTLINAAGQIADQISYGSVETDLGFARHPNGTGDFVAQQPTFNSNNNNVSVSELNTTSNIRLFPNPCADMLYAVADKKIQSAIIYDFSGRMVEQFGTSRSFDLSSYPQGIYTIRLSMQDGEVNTYRIVKR